MGSFFNELKRRKVLRVAAAYVVSSWVLLQVADLLSDILELPEWAPKLILLILIVGFVPALILSWAYDVTPDSVHGEPGDSSGKMPAIIAVLLVLAGLVAGGWWYSGKDARWAHDVGMPQVEHYIEAGDPEAAYRLAWRVAEATPDSPDMEEIWTSFTWRTSIPSAPPGAQVYRRPYDDPDAEWQYLGITPIHDTHVPFGTSVLRFEGEGLVTTLRVIGGGLVGGKDLPVENEPLAGWSNVNPGAFRLFASDSLPAGMVYVPGWSTIIDGHAVRFRDFFLGRYEVTNGEYQAFVDAGGYRRKDLWEYALMDGAKQLTFDEAMARFVDRTGRPGPGSWEAGTYRPGTADFPVTAISWYEAAAYARFAGFELPTLHHWHRAMAVGLLAWEIPASNLDSDAAVPVGSLHSLGWTGTYDMAGNAREWVFNEADDGQRIILGAGWTDAGYFVEESLSDPYRMPPLDRSATNGLRLMSSHEEAAVMSTAQLPIPGAVAVPIPEPVSDEVFAAKLRDFDYDRNALHATVDEAVEFKHWTRERISMDGEVGEERLRIYLFLPHSNASRYQTILYWPGGTAQFLESTDDYRMALDFLLRNGRAVAFPVLKGTFDRQMPVRADWATNNGRNLAVEQVREFRRMIDYLETRPDIQADKFGYFGLSWGGRMGAIVLAVEPRIKVGVLNQAGINAGDHPDINVVHFLPHVTVPVLHFSGRYDTDFRFETSSKPFFDRLGTAAEDKKHVVEATGHFVPQAIVKGETLDWFDKYLGSVE